MKIKMGECSGVPYLVILIKYVYDYRNLMQNLAHLNNEVPLDIICPKFLVLTR
jgi:hypothetical protein